MNTTQINLAILDAVWMRSGINAHVTDKRTNAQLKMELLSLWTGRLSFAIMKNISKNIVKNIMSPQPTLEFCRQWYNVCNVCHFVECPSFFESVCLPTYTFFTLAKLNSWKSLTINEARTDMEMWEIRINSSAGFKESEREVAVKDNFLIRNETDKCVSLSRTTVAKKLYNVSKNSRKSQY